MQKLVFIILLSCSSVLLSAKDYTVTQICAIMDGSITPWTGHIDRLSFDPSTKCLQFRELVLSLRSIDVISTSILKLEGVIVGDDTAVSIEISSKQIQCYASYRTVTELYIVNGQDIMGISLGNVNDDNNLIDEIIPVMKTIKQ